jgi:hypothetical protein
VSVRVTRSTIDGKLVVRIEGHLLGGQAAELEADLGTSPSPVTLDLSGLLSADPAAVRMLQALEDGGAELTGGSVYVRHLLADRVGVRS